MLWVLGLFALFASLFTLSKFALAFTAPFFLIGSRMFVAGLVLLAWEAWRNGGLKIRKEAVGSLVLLALTGIYITNIAEIWGMQYMPSAKACLVYSLSPFVAAFLAFCVLGERLTNKKWLGLVIGFMGLLPILFIPQSESVEWLSFKLPELAIVVAVFTSSLGWILLKKTTQTFSCSVWLANGLSMLIGGSLALVHSWLAGEPWAPLPITPGQELLFVESMVVMLLVSNVICYNLYGFLLKRFSATFMSFAGLVTPFFASLFGWLWLEESIYWQYWVAMTLFALGLWVFYQEERLPVAIEAP